MRIKAQIGLRLPQQAERGLSTPASGVGPVWAIINPLQARAGFCNHGMEAGVHLFDSLPRKVTSSDTRLIADDHEAMCAGMPPLERVGRARCEFQLRGIIHITPVDHEGSIAIQYDHPIAGGRLPHDSVNTATRLTVSVVL
jgi:hypothetical protein